MMQRGTWSFPFAIQTKLETVYSGHVLFKAKVRQIRRGIYLMIIVTIQNNFARARGVVESQYSRNLYTIHPLGISFDDIKYFYTHIFLSLKFCQE